jgi:uncharacterized protein (TIGR00251 family)
MADLTALKLVTKEGAVRLVVRAKPRAHKSRVVGVRDGALDVQLAAPPVDGAANAELARTLADAAGVPKSAVRILRGESGRNKLVEIVGVAENELRAALTRASE